MRTAHNLCLHYVGHGGPLFETPEDLAARIDALRAEGLAPASLADYARGPLGADRFTLSFDDAHASLVTEALEVLEAKGVTATVFVPTDYVGTSPDFLGWDGLRRLKDAGWTIGSHTATHARLAWRLYDEDEAAWRARLLDEMTRSRDAIAEALGEAPALLAYPFGEAPAVAREVAREAGYALAFTVSADAEWDGDPLAVPRLAPEPPPRWDEPTGFTVVVPACDRARILSDVVTRLASLSYPEERYEVVVVDDGSVEDLSPIFAEMPDNVRLSSAEGDRTFRAGHARQRGAEEARFDHLAFLDADVAVGPDFLWHLDWVHRRSADTVLLGYLSGYNLHDLGYRHTPDEVVGRPLSELAVIPDRSREPTLRRCLDNLGWLEAPWTLTYTGNLSLPKALLERVGGFAREYEGWGLEDIDLGVRLHRAGARFAFSRFALGFHVVDPGEGESRNPFRADPPRREAFAGYLTNLERLASLHGDDPAVQDYVARSRADIEETCGEPMTVGIELGGRARVPSLAHDRVHAIQPGGVPTEELLDRVAYAKKVRAKTLFLLGGAPAEHPGFFEVLRAARGAVRWVSMQTLVYPFAAPGLAERARDAGLHGVLALVETTERALYERLHGPGSFEAFDAGLRALEEVELERAAHMLVGRENVESLGRTVSDLEARGWCVEEVTALDPALEPSIRARLGDIELRISAADQARQA